MNRPIVQRVDFKVDTHRPHSRSKLRSKIRHLLAVASGMFPLMALFVYLMSFFQLAEQRKQLHLLALVFLGCGMGTLAFYAWARSEKLRRHEISSRNRELRYRKREDSFRRGRHVADIAERQDPSGLGVQAGAQSGQVAVPAKED